MLGKLGVLAVAAGLATLPALPAAPPALAQGMPMGSMKTAPDRDKSKDEQSKANTPTYGPNQATAPGTPERVTPTYRDTKEDRIMRELTDDGAHDRSDTRR